MWIKEEVVAVLLIQQAPRVVQRAAWAVRDRLFAKREREIAAQAGSDGECG